MNAQIINIFVAPHISQIVNSLYILQSEIIIIHVQKYPSQQLSGPVWENTLPASDLHAGEHGGDVDQEHSHALQQSLSCFETNIISCQHIINIVILLSLSAGDCYISYDQPWILCKWSIADFLLKGYKLFYGSDSSLVLRQLHDSDYSWIKTFARFRLFCGSDYHMV